MSNVPVGGPTDRFFIETEGSFHVSWKMITQRAWQILSTNNCSFCLCHSGVLLDLRGINRPGLLILPKTKDSRAICKEMIMWRKDHVSVVPWSWKQGLCAHRARHMFIENTIRLVS